MSVVYHDGENFIPKIQSCFEKNLLIKLFIISKSIISRTTFFLIKIHVGLNSLIFYFTVPESLTFINLPCCNLRHQSFTQSHVKQFLQSCHIFCKFLQTIQRYFKGLQNQASLILLMDKFSSYCHIHALVLGCIITCITKPRKNTYL